MVFRFVLFVCLMWLAGPVRAGLTLVSRETFQGVGTLDSGSPGNLRTVTGNFYKRPVGPRLTGDTSVGGLGWSADLQNQVNAYCEPAAAGTGVLPASASDDAGIYAVDLWIYLAQPAYGKQLAKVGYSKGYQIISVALSNTDGVTLVGTGSNAPAAGPGYTVPLRQWVEVRLTWEQVSGYWSYQGSILLRKAGDPTFTEIFTASSDVYTAVDTLVVGDYNLGAAPATDARLGMISTYQLGAWADRTWLVSDVIDPPAGPYHWYCNPATGSDNNDGTTAATAWASVAKINAESAGTGMFPSTAGLGNGDTLTIDGTAAPLDPGSLSLQLQTQALKVSFLGAEPFKPWATIGGAWTLAAGSTKTYQTTDNASTDLTGAVVWENDKWLNLEEGTSFAAVQAALDSTPGSFFCDGTNLYLHPFGDTVPGSDGKVYTRSRYRTGQYTSGASAILVQAPDVWIDDPSAGGGLIRKTCLARSTDGDPYNGYCVQWDVGCGGNCEISNLTVDYFSKHGMGRTVSASNCQVTRVNITYGQGSPYVGYGGQTQDVDFCDVGTGNSWAYVNCRSSVNTGVVGSAAGAITSAQPSWISHASASNNFTGGTWTNCQLCSVFTGLSGTVGPITITGTTFGGGTVSCTTNMDASRTTLEPLTLDTAGQTLTITNSILQISDSTTNYYFNDSQLTGNLVVRGSVVDLRGNLAAGGGVWSKLNSAAVTFENVLFLSNPATNFVLLDNFSSTDTIVMDHNAYVTGPAGEVVQRYDNNGTTAASDTLAQWQALGFDANSFATANPLIAANDSPLPTSSLIDAGVNLGMLDDYTGVVFPLRNDIGAYEYVPSSGGPIPVITSPLTAAGQVGQPFSYQIAASNSPVSFTASGLPAGLNCDSSGLISGTPPAAGSIAVTISAINTGGAGTATLNLTIAPVLPTITLTAPVSKITAGTQDVGEFLLTRTGDDLSTPVTVTYKVGGTAINGTDYALLKGSKTMKAGKGSVKIKVTPLGDGPGPGNKAAVALTLLPGTDYIVGTAAKVKVHIAGQ